MSDAQGAEVVQSGRKITPEEVEQIRLTVELFPNLARWELAETLCEHLGWRTAAGGNKADACMKLLERLEQQGLISIPARRWKWGPRSPGDPPMTDRTTARAEVTGALAELGRVWLDVAGRGEEEALWNEYMARHHYLGYHKPFGCPLRYFVRSREGVLGCVLLAGPAKAVAVRDRWIGWTREQRTANLPWVVNNTRYLILPWVHVRHLASHVLGMVARQVAGDWYQRWGYRPVLMETFVDPSRFRGTCYRAAGWVELGRTTGQGLAREGRTYKTTPKTVLVRPLDPGFRAKLCSETPERGACK